MKHNGSDDPEQWKDSVGSPGQWQEELLKKNMEMWTKASETHRQSMEACADVAKIIGKHMEELTERIRKDGSSENKSPSELYREMTQANSEIFKEAMRAPSILRLLAMNLDVFLDWKTSAESAQEQYKESMGLVTRSELSQIYKTLYDLKRDLDRLSRSTTEKGDTHNAQRQRSRKRR